MSSRVRRRVIVLGACTSIVAATLALPANTLSSVTASLLRLSSSAQTPDEPTPITSVPKEDRAKGQVYTGLKPAKARTPCVGMYVIENLDTKQCSHGPDKPPPGLDVRKPVAPIAPATRTAVKAPTSTPTDAQVAGDAGLNLAPGNGSTPGLIKQGTANAIGPNGVVCEGDGRSGKRVQVLYVREVGVDSRFAALLESFRKWSAGADLIYSNSAKETGGERHVRFVTTPDCKVDVVSVEVPAGSMDDFGKSMNALKQLGYGEKNRMYMIFGEDDTYCGIGTFRRDDRPGANNNSNIGPAYGRSDKGCWSAGVVSHELGHNLGAVTSAAPNSDKKGHCTDDHDLMCYGPNMRSVCTDPKSEKIMDCRHDDYYSTDPAPGSWLATHWNTANNQFLIQGPGGDHPPPSPSPTPVPPSPSPVPPSPTPVPPSPSPSPSPVPPSPSPVPPSPSPVPPSPSPSPDDPGPTVSPDPDPDPDTGLQKLVVTEASADSVRLTWAAAAAGSEYSVTSNGRSIGTTRNTSVKVIRLRAGQTYKFQILSRTGTAAFAPHTVVAEVTAGGTAPSPIVGSVNIFTNALTGMAVDVYEGRKTAGNQVIAWPKHGSTNQQWQVEAAADGTVLLRSKASNMCLAPTSKQVVENALIVQYVCDSADVTQRWRIAATEFGYSLTTAQGDLVLGVGTGQGTAKPLVLQRASGARFQSWAATKV